MARAAVKTGSGYLLKEQDVRSRRDLKDMGFLYFSISAVVIIVAVIFLYLWCRLTVVNLGYEISALNEARAVETERNKRLRVELMRLKSPERIERIAVEELGLVYASGDRIVRIK